MSTPPSSSGLARSGISTSRPSPPSRSAKRADIGASTIDAFATEGHYRAHLQPIFDALPDDQRGTFHDRKHPPSAEGGPIMVAGFKDLPRVRRRIAIYVEHGAGQTYSGDSARADRGGYSGGRGAEKVGLFVCPSETVADRWRERYDVPAVAVGCPLLDRYHAVDGRRSARQGPPTVAVSFHWRCPYVPESMWAFPHYRNALADLVAWARTAGVRLVGHGHPRAWRDLKPVWEQLGVETEADGQRILDQADVLVCDNSSLQAESASIGVRQVFLNAPRYRRDVEHGGRFWSWPTGQISCDRPGDLISAVEAALADSPEAVEGRRRMTESVYAYTDGHASARAAHAIAGLLASVA